MKDPNINTEVKHSESKSAWNVVGTRLGGKHKIARVPYLILKEGEYSEMHNTREKAEALDYALFISYCFNSSKKILG